MTYREYLEKCDDEFEKTVIIANLARRHPNYNSYSQRVKKEVRNALLDEEMPTATTVDELRWMDDHDKRGL